MDPRFARLSDDDLRAVAEGDYAKVSTRGLQILAGEEEAAAAPAAPRAMPTRSAREALKDFSLQLNTGIGQTIALPGQLYGLATGNFEPTGALGLGTRMQERARALYSPGLKAKEAALTERIQKAEQERGQTAAFKEAALGTLTDPALLTGAIAESIPAMIPAVGLGSVVGRKVAQRAAAQGAEAAAARAAGTTAGVGVAKGVGAIQQGAEVGAESYKNLFDEFIRQGLSEPEAAKRTLNAARAAGASGTIISYLAQSLPGASGVERALIGGEARALSRLGSAVSKGFGEAVGESVEEGGGRATQNVAMREAIPGQSILAGVGEAAGRAAAAGAGVGGAAGALQRGPEPKAQPAPPPPPPSTDGAPPLAGPPGTQGELFTETEAPRGPTPEGLAQNKAYYDRLQGQLDQLTREQKTVRARLDSAADPAEQAQLQQRAASITEQISNVAGEMARYAPTIPSVSQEPRIDTEARGEEAERTERFQSLRQEFDTLQRENQRIKAEYERASVLEDRVQRVQETTRLRREAELLAPNLRAIQAEMARLRPTILTQDAQRPAAAEGQLDLKLDDRIQIQDLPPLGIPMDGGTPAQRAVRGWMRDNVVGKTPTEIAELTRRDPTLLQGTGLRARALADILAQEAAPTAFEETPSAPAQPPATTPVQGELDLGGAEPSVGVPSGSVPPSGRAAGAPATAPTPPTGGLDTSERPAGTRAGDEGAPRGPLGGEQIGLDFEGETPAPAVEEAPEPPQREGYVRVYHSGSVGEGKTGRWASTSREYAANYRPDLPLLYTDLPADDPRVNNLDYPEQGVKQGFTFNFELTPVEAAQLRPISRTAPPAPAAPAEGTAPTVPAVDQEAAAAAKKAAAAAKRKARAEARKAEAEARQAEAEARAAEEAAKQAEEAAKQAEAEAKRRADEEAEAQRKADEEAKKKKDAAAAKRKATREAKKAAAADPDWVTKAEQDLPASTRVAFDGDTLVLMVMRKSRGGGILPYFYIADKRTAPTPFDSTLAKVSFPPEAIQYATAQLSNFAVDEKARLAAYPDGPFTDSKEPVVGADALDPKYAQFLNELYKKLGLERTGARVFLTTIRPDSAMRDKYRLYGVYTRALAYRGDDVRGYHVGYGLGSNDILIAVDPDLDPQILLEVIGHEFGHAIQRVMYNNAPQATRDAIRKEYEAWYKKATTGTVGQFVRSRMTPRRAEESLASPSVDTQASVTTLRDLDYWLKFDEWFADQVARWVVTDDKPIGVVQQFFASVAAKMRKLVALLGKKETAPAASVKKFLDEMYAGTREMRDIADSWRPSMPAAPPAPMRSSLVDMPEEQAEEMRSLSALMNPKGGMSLNMGQDATDFITKVRTRIADKAATALEAVSKDFNGAVRNELGKTSLEPLYRQAEASDQLVPAFLRMGALIKEKSTGLWRAASKPGLTPPAEILNVVADWGKRNNLSFQEAWAESGKIMESARQKEFQGLNASMAKGREFPVSMSDADIQKYYQIYSTDPTFNKTLRKILDAARFDLIDNMVKVGRIPQEMADDWKTATAYIPFDRVEDLETLFRGGRRIGRGIAQLGEANPQLVDADTVDRQVKNSLDNYFNWMGWGVRQVVQTDATIKTLAALRKEGLAKVLPGGLAQRNSNNKDRVVKAYIDGNEVYYETQSAYHAAAFNMSVAPLPPIFGVFTKISQVLRTAITAVPTFTATQIPQDIQRAILYSGVKDPAALTARVLSNFTEYSEAAVLGKLPQVTHELGEYGIAGDFDFRMDGAADAFLRSMGAKPRAGGKLGETVQRLSDVARASDFALRRAIYEQTMAEGGDQLLALHRAREIINFRRYGMGDQLGIVHMLTQVIPFYNAYIQGMDVLYRGLTGTNAASGLERKAALSQFYTTAAYAVAVSTLYALAKAGDDEYENMDLRERDKTWVIGEGFGIPVPGELGLLFKALPERVLETFRKQGTPDEIPAAEAAVSWFKAAFDEYSGRGAMPAAVKPLLENLSNYSFLTQRPLEGMFQQQLLPSERTTERTSGLAREIARFTAATTDIQISPIKIDNFLQGYFGTTASLLFATTDSLLNPDKMDRPLHQMVGLSAYAYDPVGTRRASEFYEIRDKVVQTQNTLNKLMKEDMGRAAAFADKNADKLMFYKAVNSTLKEIERTRAYRTWLGSAEAARGMTQKERADEMESVKRYEQDLFSWVREARKDMKL